MDYPFRMQGQIIEIYRFNIEYNVNGKKYTDHCTTLDEASYATSILGGAVIPIDTSSFEWLDGLEVDDVPDTFSKAVEIYDMGEVAYWQNQAFIKGNQVDQLRADIDFIAIVTGIPLWE